MSQKIINLIRFVGNHVYQVPKSNCFIAAGAIGGTQRTVQFIIIVTLESFGD